MSKLRDAFNKVQKEFHEGKFEVFSADELIKQIDKISKMSMEERIINAILNGQDEIIIDVNGKGYILTIKELG